MCNAKEGIPHLKLRCKLVPGHPSVMASQSIFFYIIMVKFKNPTLPEEGKVIYFEPTPGGGRKGMKGEVEGPLYSKRLKNDRGRLPLKKLRGFKRYRGILIS